MKQYEGYKYCPRCKEVLPIIMFTKDTHKIDNLSLYCKDCNCNRFKSWLDKNKEYDKERNKIWRDNNIEYNLERVKEWRENNKDLKREYEKNYRKTNSGKLAKHKTRNNRRKLKSIELFINPFPEDIKVEYHHINNLLVIPLPKGLHQACNGGTTNKHREKCNKKILSLYGLDINKLFSE